jgi:hypothetical protein
MVTTLLTRLAALRIVGQQADTALVERGAEHLVGVEKTVAADAGRTVAPADTTPVKNQTRVGHTIATQARLVKETSVCHRVKAHTTGIDL